MYIYKEADKLMLVDLLKILFFGSLFLGYFIAYLVLIFKDKSYGLLTEYNIPIKPKSRYVSMRQMKSLINSEENPEALKKGLRQSLKYRRFLYLHLLLGVICFFLNMIINISNN